MKLKELYAKLAKLNDEAVILADDDNASQKISLQKPRRSKRLRLRLQ